MLLRFTSTGYNLNLNNIENRGTGFAFNILFRLVLLKLNVMKKFLTTTILLAMFTTCTTMMAQHTAGGIPGSARG